MKRVRHSTNSMQIARYNLMQYMLGTITRYDSVNNYGAVS